MKMNGYKLITGKLDKFEGTTVNYTDGFSNEVMLINDEKKECMILYRKLGIIFMKYYSDFLKEHKSIKKYTVEFLTAKTDSGKTFTTIKKIEFLE